MEANLAKIMHLRIKRTIDALEKNNMKALYVPGRQEALTLLKTMLVKGETIGTGGSVTFLELGVIDLLRNGDYRFLDRYDPALAPEDVWDLLAKTLLADTYLTSSNAITETGLLYNVDGNSNRVAAMLFGPRRVIVIAGQNKIVPSVEDALTRLKTTAAPANCIRLGLGTYCSGKGRCMTPNQISPPPGACENTICCNTVIMGRQRIPGRITVIIVGENLGY